MSGKSATVEIGMDLIHDLANYPKMVSNKLFSNLVTPLKNGNTKEHLQGRYKASYGAGKLFDAIYREKNLHHYHFGYPFYKPSQKPGHIDYISDGIAHIMLHESNSHEHHIVYDVDLTHNPFTVSLNFKQIFITPPLSYLSEYR